MLFKLGAMSPPLSAPRVSPASETSLQPTLFSLLFSGALGLWLLVAPSLFCNHSPTDNNYWPTALGVLCLAVVGLFGALDKEVRFRVDGIGLGLLLFCGWNFVATLTGIYKHDAWLEMARLTGGLFVYFALRAFPQRNLSTATCAVVGAFVPATLAILNFFSTHDMRQAAGFLNANLFAALLGPTLMLSPLVPAFVWRSTRSIALTRLAFLPFVVLALALALTSSKGGFLAALVGGCVLLATTYRARKNTFQSGLKRAWPLVLILVVAFGLVAARTVGKRLSQAQGADDNSTQFRVYLWRSTFNMANAKPVLGFGPGSFPTAYPRFAQVSYTRTAHQSWLQIASEAGWPALILLLGTFALAVRSGWRKLKTSDWAQAACALAALCTIFVHGFFDAGWSILAILALVSVALALCAPTEPPRAGEARGGLNWPFLGAILVLVLAGYGTQMVANGADLLAQGEEQLSNGVAPTTAQPAVETDPGSARAWNFLGRVTPTDARSTWTRAFERAIQLQPDGGSHPLNLARQIDRLPAPTGDDLKQISALYDRAIELDPLNSSYRLERAKWRLDHKDGRGYDDLKFILDEWDTPYGKYPALGRADDINLDFARATLAIAPRLKAQSQAARLKALAKRALEDCAAARQIQTTRAEFLKAMKGRTSVAKFDDLDELESGLKSVA